jgi:hypothetical protein
MPSLPIPGFPFTVDLPSERFLPDMFANHGIRIQFNSGLITFLGPNGSGKTSALKALRDFLRENYGRDIVRYVSAGRMGVLEIFRSNVNGGGMNDPAQTYTGGQNFLGTRKLSETVTGDFLALEARSDIKLKVEARLQGIFGKTLILNWAQNGLQIHFKSIVAGSKSYGAGLEASGLTQMVAILAALYDDEIKFLLIDEPEVSLHPQLQSFILKEIKAFSGNPNTLGKKIVVISTHSPSILPIQSVMDLTSILFFRDLPDSTIQIAQNSPLLTDPTMVKLILRLNDLYKIAFFSKSVFLTEGVSDQIIISSIVDKFDENFSSNGNQLVSVGGKNQLVVADKLFSLIGKKVTILADLDVLDNDRLIAYFDSKDIAGLIIPGYATLTSLYANAYEDLTNIINANWTDIQAHAVNHRYWSATDTLEERKRSALVFLLNATDIQLDDLNNSLAWKALKLKFNLLLNTLDGIGLNLIRKGTIEDCYINPAITGAVNKSNAASLELEYLPTANQALIEHSYVEVIKGINFIKLRSKVDEAFLLREKLGGVLGAVFSNLDNHTSDQDIQNIIEKTDINSSKIFKIVKENDPNGETILKIELVSPLFSNYTGPIYQNEAEPISELKQKLPSA